MAEIVGADPGKYRADLVAALCRSNPQTEYF
jgi:hypothetical protein